MKRIFEKTWPYLTLFLPWEIILIIQKSSWQNFILLPTGASIGYFILEIKWFFPKKEVLKMLPFILLPLTFFILTSTPGVFEKALIVSLNLRLLLDKKRFKQDNLKI